MKGIFKKGLVFGLGFTLAYYAVGLCGSIITIAAWAFVQLAMNFIGMMGSMGSMGPGI